MLQRHLKYQSNAVAQVKFFSAAVAGHLGRLAHPTTHCKILMLSEALEKKGDGNGSSVHGERLKCGRTDT